MRNKKAPYKLLVCVVEKSKADMVLGILKNAHETLGISNLVEGTSKMGSMDIMGLARNERTMIMTVVRTENAKRTIQALDLLLCPDDTSFGIAFTVKLNSASRETLNFFNTKREGI